MLFISFIGRIIIIFLYFTRIINNQKSKFIQNKKQLYIYICIFLIIIFLLLINPLELININYTFTNKFIYKIYIYPLNLLTILSIIYLLYILILVIKICSNKFIPLRKIKN